MIYQVFIQQDRQEVLQRIEEVSRVKWNSGQLPTEYDPSNGMLTISDDVIDDDCFHVACKHLFIDNKIPHSETCTTDEFVAHCKKMLPRD